MLIDCGKIFSSRDLSLGSGRRATLDATDALAFGNTDLEVAVDTPRWSPAVLDEVVLTGDVVSAVADSEDTVVELGAAAIRSDNTTSVMLEHGLVSLNGHRHGLVVKSSLQRDGIVQSHIVEGLDADDAITYNGLALAEEFLSLVRVLGLRFDECALSVREGIVHESTSAAHISSALVAVDELLLREGDEIASLDLVSTFHGSSGREGPARAAATLVLDTGDGAGSYPVDGVLVLRGPDPEVELLAGAELWLVAENTSELSVGPVRHVIVAHGRCVVEVAGPLLNFEVLGCEFPEAEGVLLSGAVAAALLNNPLHELLFDIRNIGGESFDAQ
jgi:hypothetical protein